MILDISSVACGGVLFSPSFVCLSLLANMITQKVMSSFSRNFGNMYILSTTQSCCCC